MNRIRYLMAVSARSYIDPLIGLYEVEKLPEIKIIEDKSSEKNKKKEPNLPRERNEALNDLIAAFVFVQEKVVTDLKVK